jgi:hypothetical protein
MEEKEKDIGKIDIARDERSGTFRRMPAQGV